MTNRTSIQQPNPKIVDKRFKFVTDNILRSNISNTFSFIIFLDSIENYLQLPELYKNLIYKTMIIFSASILESLLFFKLKTLLATGKIKEDEILSKKFKYNELSKVIVDSNKFENPIVLCEKLQETIKFKKNTQFHEIIIYAKRCGLMTETLFRDCNEIKDIRNNLHMSAMTEVDNNYTRESVNDVFKKVKMIIDRIEHY